MAMSNPTVQEPKSTVVILAFVAVYLIWGSTYFGIRVAIETMPPLLMAGARFVLAGILMMGVGFWRGGARPTGKQWRDAFIVGGCLLLVGNGGVTVAERHIPSGLTALLVATVPMFLALFGWWTGGAAARPSVLLLAALAVGFAGVYLLVRPTISGADGTPPAEARMAVGLVLVASAVWAAGSLYSKRASKPSSAVLSVGMQMLAGGILLAAGGVMAGEVGSFHFAQVSARSVYAFGYLVFIGAIVGFSAYIWLMQVSEPALVGTYAFVNPVVAVLLGWALADERVSREMLWGMALILGSVVVVVCGPLLGRVRRTPP